MKRRIILSIALVLSVVLISLTSSDSAVNAQRNRLYKFSSGLVTPGVNQILRVAVNGGSGSDTVNVQFTRKIAGQPTCNGGVCRSFYIIIEALPVIMVPVLEAVSMDVAPMPNSGGVAAEIVTNDPNARVTGMIINQTTGEVDSFVVMQYFGY